MENKVINEISIEQKNNINRIETLSFDKIETAEQFDDAGKAILEIATIRKGVVEFFKDTKDAAYKLWKMHCAKEGIYLDRVDEIRDRLNKNRSDYKLELERQERIRQDQLRKEAEEIARKEQEKLLAQAIKAEESGKVEKAETLVIKAAEVKPVVYIAPVQSPPKTSGVSDVAVWSAEVENPDLVPVKINGFMLRPIDQAMLNRIAKNSNGQTVIPGVKMVKSYGTQARGVR